MKERVKGLIRKQAKVILVNLQGIHQLKFIYADLEMGYQPYGKVE